MLFKINFGIMGAGCIGSILADYIPVLYPQIPKKTLLDKNVNFIVAEQHLFITTYNLISYTIGITVSVLYVYTNHWTLNNILGIVFTVSGISMIKITNFRTCFGLLWLLFFYDIFWVFKSDVMVTVAKNFDVPIKLFLVNSGKKSILGLGDMVLPGILVALALKFDVDMAIEKFNSSKVKEKTLVVVKSYFWACMIGYGLGIVATFIGMTLMNHAQPALLYLVPGCTGSIVVQSIVLGQFKKMWKYEALKIKEKEEKKQ